MQGKDERGIRREPLRIVVEKVQKAAIIVIGRKLSTLMSPEIQTVPIIAVPVKALMRFVQPSNGATPFHRLKFQSDRLGEKDEDGHQGRANQDGFLEAHILCHAVHLVASSRYMTIQHGEIMTIL